MVVVGNKSGHTGIIFRFQIIADFNFSMFVCGYHSWNVHLIHTIVSLTLQYVELGLDLWELPEHLWQRHRMMISSFLKNV